MSISPAALGPTEGFAETLRAAIAARGLSLDRIREHLARRGVSLSLATLSYWQTGRSLPERRASLAAVRHLEDVLALEAGTLSELLGPALRGRRRQDVRHRRVVADARGDRRRGRRRRHRWDSRLTRISQHDHVTVGPGSGRARRSGRGRCCAPRRTARTAGW